MASNQKTDRFYYGWVVLLALVVIGITSQGIRFSYGVFFESLETDFGWSRAETSGVFSVYMIFCSIFAILGGWALDKYGPRTIVVVMGFFTGLSLLLTSQVNTPWHLFITYSLLLAIGTGTAYAFIMSMASIWYVKRRGLALGIASSGMGIGMMVMPPIAAWLIGINGWHGAYFVMGLIAIITITPWALLLKKPPDELVVSRENETLEVTNVGSHRRQGNSQMGEFFLVQLAKTRNLWLIFVINLLWGYCVFIAVTHIVRHAIDLGIVSVEAATILSVYGISGIPGRLVMGRLSDSIGRKQALVICALLAIGAMLWLTQASNLWMLYLFAVLLGLSHGGAGPTVTAITADVFGIRHIGVIMGMSSAAWAAGAALGSALAGYIFDVSGNYILAFLTGAMAMLIVLMLIFLVRTPIAKVGGEAIS